jgi:hypothetical protein
MLKLSRETILMASGILLIIFLIAGSVWTIGFLARNLAAALDSDGGAKEAVIKFDLEGFKALELEPAVPPVAI